MAARALLFVQADLLLVQTSLGTGHALVCGGAGAKTERLEQRQPASDRDGARPRLLRDAGVGKWSLEAPRARGWR